MPRIKCPIPFPTGWMEFNPLNPPFKALHQLVIPAQLESPTLQLCPCSGLPWATRRSPDKLFSVNLLMLLPNWKALLPGHGCSLFETQPSDLLFNGALTQPPRHIGLPLLGASLSPRPRFYPWSVSCERVLHKAEGRHRCLAGDQYILLAIVPSICSSVSHLHAFAQCTSFLLLL